MRAYTVQLFDPYYNRWVHATYTQNKQVAHSIKKSYWNAHLRARVVTVGTP